MQPFCAALEQTIKYNESVKLFEAEPSLEANQSKVWLTPKKAVNCQRECHKNAHKCDRCVPAEAATPAATSSAAAPSH